MKNYEDRSRDVAEKLNQLKKKQKTRRIILGTCLPLLAVVLVVAMFIPYDNTPPEVDEYERDPYYKVIAKLNELTYTPPRYDNAFDAVWGQISNGMDFVADGGAAPEGGMDMAPAVDAENAGEYVEVTDNQVAGVIEADIFKRSDRYLYYLSGNVLSVYSIAGADSVCLSNYSIATQGKDEGTDFYYVSAAEMYLSADCTTVTVIMEAENKEMGAVIAIYQLDVTDPANIRELDYVLFPGSLISTRLTDGKLLLAYNFRVHASDIDFDDPETFVPSYGKPGDMTCVEADDIICPDTATDTKYTVICMLDGETLAVEDSKALLSYAQELYVSENAIYATHSYSEKSKVDANVYSTQAMTKISGISYGADGLCYRGSIDLPGNVRDQYAMDEYADILRVVVNTSYQVYEEYQNELTAGVSMGNVQRNVSLYCIDLQGWDVEASVLGFAPEGERAESVRFDGAMAYVCTAEVITLTDPVYFFDLSDLENITWTDTGTIDGYSTSLVQWGNGFLLGIGYGDEWQLKVEVYEEEQGKVVSVDAWEEEASFSTFYKSYLIDRENSLVGIPVSVWQNGMAQYLLLHFNGYELQEVLRINLDAYDLATTRACIIDDCLYVVNSAGLTVEKVW